MKFTQWLCFTCFISLMHYFCYMGGYLNNLIETDITYICSMIFGLFIVATLNIGLGLLYKEKKYESLKKTSDFISNALTGLGLLGTVLGMIIAMKSFSSYNIQAADPQKMISDLTSGMYSALYTTAVGIVYSMLLDTQSFFLLKKE